ncbi:protein tas-like isoform X4 [Telopea speciosissima]|uniref:protein tas-like isoform X4 n=1 Tax=Telopea speciosissima TaxID=54955 RepID=UPI001CC7E458|nr:protein tas-like isoform X4 [Telopea speciosissima]
MAVPLFNLAPGLKVSRLCLGTMTFGEQNSLQQSFRLLDEAFDAGINFIDSAEMYSVPQRAETQGRSEEYVGLWIKERKIPRDRVVLATKVTGPSGQMTWIRGGPKCLDASNIMEAIGNSLLRMQTDYIDLYQIHWPDRYVPMFGETDYDLTRQFSSVSIDEQLDTLGKAVDAGKNSYSLLCRSFDSGLAECCHHERVSLLAYSPLAMGILSGKYFSPDGGPVDARMNLFRGKYAEGESRYNLSNSRIKAATKAYLDIAEKYALSPVSLAIAYVLKHPLVASAVFGATKEWQLREVLGACDVKLTPEITVEIDEVHRRYPNPCP